MRKIDYGNWPRREIFEFFSGRSKELDHRFADGVHVGMFAKELERLIEGL